MTSSRPLFWLVDLTLDIYLFYIVFGLHIYSVDVATPKAWICLTTLFISVHINLLRNISHRGHLYAHIPWVGVPTYRPWIKRPTTYMSTTSHIRVRWFRQGCIDIEISWCSHRFWKFKWNSKSTLYLRILKMEKIFKESLKNWDFYPVAVLL